MKQKGAKVMAILALLGIILSVIGTGMLYLMQPKQGQKQTITQEELQKMIDSGQIKLKQTTQKEKSENNDTTKNNNDTSNVTEETENK